MPAWHAAHLISDHFICVLVSFFTSTIHNLPLSSIVSSFPFLQCRWRFPHSPLSNIVIYNNSTLIVFLLWGTPKPYFRTTAFLLFPIIVSIILCEVYVNFPQWHAFSSCLETLTMVSELIIVELQLQNFFHLNRDKKGSPKSIQPDNQKQPSGGVMAGLLFQVSHLWNCMSALLYLPLN